MIGTIIVGFLNYINPPPIATAVHSKPDELKFLFGKCASILLLHSLSQWYLLSRFPRIMSQGINVLCVCCVAPIADVLPEKMLAKDALAFIAKAAPGGLAD